MKNWAKLLGVFILAWFWLPQSQAALLLIQGDVTDTLTFGNSNDFSGAQVHRHISITQNAGAAGDTGVFTFTLSSPSINVAATGDAHIAVSAFSVSPAQATFTRTSTDGLTGKFALDFDRISNTGGTLTTTASGGHYVLEASSNVNIGLVAGSLMTFTAVIPGDWSVAGSATGNHQLISINPLWTIDQNFIFSAGQTIFSAHIDSYVNDGLHNAQLNYRLIGAAAIPVPAGWTLFIIGLAALRLTRRMRA